MSKLTIKKDILINAPSPKVWKVLVDPAFTLQWGSAFSEGENVETDCKKGSEVLWKDNAHDHRSRSFAGK